MPTHIQRASALRRTSSAAKSALNIRFTPLTSARPQPASAASQPLIQSHRHRAGRNNAGQLQSTGCVQTQSTHAVEESRRLGAQNGSRTDHCIALHLQSSGHPTRDNRAQLYLTDFEDSGQRDAHAASLGALSGHVERLSNPPD